MKIIISLFPYPLITYMRLRLNLNENNYSISKVLKQNILNIIKSGVDNTEERLKETTIYNKLSYDIESLLKFASFYLTAENLEIMREKIENEYKKYIVEFASSYKDFKEKISKLRKTNPIKNNDFENLIDKNMDSILSNLNVLQNSKQLLIIGYIIGLLSDDYIYNLIIKNYNLKASENLSEGTIYNLLDMDLDLSYFLKQIKNIRENIESDFSQNHKIINEAKMEIEKYKKRAI